MTLGSRNRKIELLATVCFGIGEGVVVVLSSNLLLQYAGSTLFVGLAEGVPAILPLLLSFPIGVWFDRHPTSKLPLYFGLILLFVACAGQAILVASFTVWFGLAAYWGLFLLFVVQFVSNGIWGGVIFFFFFSWCLIHHASQTRAGGSDLAKLDQNWKQINLDQCAFCAVDDWWNCWPFDKHGGDWKFRDSAVDAERHGFAVVCWLLWIHGGFVFEAAHFK